MTDTTEVTARQELEEIAGILREADEAEKAAKELKDEVKGPFFDLISEVVREEVLLARRTEVVEIGDDEFDPEAWRKLNFPLHNIVGISFEGSSEAATKAHITLEESDQFKKYEFTVGGYKFGRTVRMDGKGFMVDKFAHTLADKERKIPAALRKKLLSTVSERMVIVREFDEAKAQELMAEHPETVALFQEFINPGVPKIALLPIKAIKEPEEE